MKLFGMTDIFFILGAFLMGGSGAWLLASYGHRLNIIDKASDRSSHKGVIPKAGGVGILISFICVGVKYNIPYGLLIPAIVVSIVSFVNDQNSLHSGFRLLIHFLCAVWALKEGVNQDLASWYGILFPLGVVFIVGTTNINNFMDGIDGMAGIMAVVAFGSLAISFSIIEIPSQFMVLFCSMVGASLGFLIFNYPHARVFMGDVGSILLGFVFGVMVLSMSENISDFLCFAAFFLWFYLDEFITMSIRIWNREPVTKAHRKHIYQLMANDLGVVHWKVSLGYGIVQACICCAAILLHERGTAALVGLYAVCSVMFILLAIMVWRKVLDQ